MKIQLKTGLLLSIASIFFSLSLKAQHCKYDFLGLIGVVPYVDDTKKIIDGLYITLTDSLGSPVMQSHPVYNKNSQLIENKGTTFVFWRNPKPNKDVYHYNKDVKTRHFHFADNHYLVILNYNYIYYLSIKKDNKALEAVQKCYIKIEDKDSLENGGYFEPLVLAVTSDRYLPLCGVPLTEKDANTGYQPFFVNLVQSDNNIDKVPHINFTANELSLYDSVSVLVDTLRDVTYDLPTTLVQTTDYYKSINDTMVVVKRIVRRNKWLSERIDSWIYELKDGKLTLIGYEQGAE